MASVHLFVMEQYCKNLDAKATQSYGDASQMVIDPCLVHFGSVTCYLQDPTSAVAIKLCNFGFGDFPTSPHSLMSRKLLFHTGPFLGMTAVEE